MSSLKLFQRLLGLFLFCLLGLTASAKHIIAIAPVRHAPKLIDWNTPTEIEVDAMATNEQVRRLPDFSKWSPELRKAEALSVQLRFCEALKRNKTKATKVLFVPGENDAVSQVRALADFWVSMVIKTSDLAEIVLQVRAETILKRRVLVKQYQLQAKSGSFGFATEANQDSFESFLTEIAVDLLSSFAALEAKRPLEGTAELFFATYIAPYDFPPDEYLRRRVFGSSVSIQRTPAPDDPLYRAATETYRELLETYQSADPAGHAEVTQELHKAIDQWQRLVAGRAQQSAAIESMYIKINTILINRHLVPPGIPKDTYSQAEDFPFARFLEIFSKENGVLEYDLEALAFIKHPLIRNLATKISKLEATKLDMRTETKMRDRIRLAITQLDAVWPQVPARKLYAEKSKHYTNSK